MSSHEPITDELTLKIEALIQPLGYGLVSIEIHKNIQPKLKLTVEYLTNEKSISINDCSTISKLLDTALDEMLDRVFMTMPYALEISSPGMFRKLTSDNDFLRFKGNRIKIHSYQAFNAEQVHASSAFKGKKDIFIGILENFTKTHIELFLETSKKHQEIKVKIPRNHISKINLEPALDALFKGDEPCPSSAE